MGMDVGHGERERILDASLAFLAGPTDEASRRPQVYPHGWTKAGGSLAPGQQLLLPAMHLMKEKLVFIWGFSSGRLKKMREYEWVELGVSAL